MPKILLIEDSKTLLKHISRVLTDGGHEVVAKSTGSAAVEYLRENTVEAVLTDLYMPDTDGFEVIHHVRALPQPPPLIVMSACAVASGVFRDGQALGAAASLHKPFKPEQLLSVIDDVLRSAAV